jgi:hypothetical protein
MSSVSKSSGARKKEARDRRILAKARRENREEKPASLGNRRLAKQPELTQVERYDSERVSMLRGDLNLVVAEIQAGFEEILDAEFYSVGAERDSLVLNVLRRLRNAETVIGATTRGAS